MKKSIQAQQKIADLSLDTTEKQIAKRRDLLKATGAVGGLAAAGAWSKPMLNSVVLPAHAGMSVDVEPEPEPQAIMMGGGTSSVAAVVLRTQSTKESIAQKAIDAVIPTANAQETFSGTCGLLVNEGDNDNTHCIALEFPAGDDVNGAINFNLEGPDIYYGFNGTYYNYNGTVSYYYSGVLNLSGSMSSTMTDREFELELNGLSIVGEVSEDFSSATGEIVVPIAQALSDGSDSLRTSSLNASGPDCGGQGYGAFWDVDLTGTSCTPGQGVADSSNIVIGDVRPN